MAVYNEALEQKYYFVMSFCGILFQQHEPVKYQLHMRNVTYSSRFVWLAVSEI